MMSSISWVPKGVSKPVVLITEAMMELLTEIYGDDPYLKNHNDYSYEELCVPINPTDSLIVCARVKEQGRDSFGVFEVWILIDEEKYLYFHHDIRISALPLCSAWLDYPLEGGERGNFLAVGSIEPNIQIFNVDVVSEFRDGKGTPCMVLGSTEDDGHSDSVLGLAWNKEYRNIIASASADTKVKIWDMVSGKCESTMTDHTDKVQAVAWNPHSPRSLLTGSFDGTVFLKDGRITSHDGCKWELNAKVESLAWDPHSEHSFVVSLENGTVKLIDVRTAKSDSGSEFNANEHGKAVTSVSYNLAIPNLLATGSLDNKVKLWDLSNNQPSCVASYSPKVWPVCSISFSEENPFLLAIGGSKGIKIPIIERTTTLEVWDTQSYSGISEKYGNYMK
ncbi:periodic tryptophan protein 1 homolog [Vigna radiata var. radiata]|uniref:Periodic tryptophan protein 1 homolog n=1 Tax=Vigna radiata var. radiata TaxID=3916 RepID=A0A3Q0ESY6_VIGRR|nr:periodic tryptophan protein 1 homolog [Vigna radiata var. radiata]